MMPTAVVVSATPVSVTPSVWNSLPSAWTMFASVTITMACTKENAVRLNPSLLTFLINASLLTLLCLHRLLMIKVLV